MTGPADLKALADTLEAFADSDETTGRHARAAIIREAAAVLTGVYTSTCGMEAEGRNKPILPIRVTTPETGLREAVAKLIDDEPFRTLDEWRDRARVVCADLGFEWSEAHEQLARRNYEVSTRRDGSRKDAALAKADAILSLLSKGEGA